MKKILLSMVSLLVVCLMVTSIPSISFADTVTSFSLTQSPDNVPIGEKLEVTINGNNLKDLYAYEAVISFDQTILELDKATSKIEGFSVPPKAENNKMSVAFTKIGKKAGENGTEPLATISYKVKAKGDANLKLEWVKALDSKLTPITYQYAAKTFSDLAGYDWAKTQIESLLALGVIRGTSETTFSPGKNITRADFLCILVRALKFTTAIDGNFDDVKATDYYYSAVGTAKKLGITMGYEGNVFRPKDFISRQDMMVMVVKAMKLNGAKFDESAPDLSKFSDSGEVSAYAANAVSLLVKQGIIHGSGNRINPKGTATRAETAVIMYTILKK